MDIERWKSQIIDELQEVKYFFIIIIKMLKLPGYQNDTCNYN